MQENQRRIVTMQRILRLQHNVFEAVASGLQEFHGLGSEKIFSRDVNPAQNNRAWMKNSRRQFSS